MNAIPPLQDVAAMRAALWQAGYHPVPVFGPDAQCASPGKQPMGNAWQEAARRAPPAAVVEPPHPDALNTGILCDGLRAVDIDVDDPEVAGRLSALAETMLGKAPCRSRENSGRVLLVYRAAEGEPHKTKQSGEHGAIEVLGKGQQFVAYGQHPSGAALQWAPRPLHHQPRPELPAVTEDALAGFLRACEGMLGAKPQAAPGEVPPPRDDDHKPSSHGPAGDALDVAAALAVIPNTGKDWDLWNRVGLATWHATNGSESGFGSWCGWSQRCKVDGIHDDAACRRAWQGFNRTPPDDIGAGTLFHLARKARPGWRKPSENAKEPSERPRPITARELLRMDIPPRRMLLAPYLPTAGSAMVFAPRGIGKTWVSLSIAYAVASGGEVLRGRAPEPARVLFVDGEMPLVTLQERLVAVALGIGKEPPADDFLRFLPADHFRDGLPDLASAKGRELVEELAQDVDLVVLDNLSSLARYPENEADGWQPLQDLVLSLRRQGKTTLLIHHAGKNGEQRGSSRREDLLDTSIALRRPDEYEATEGARFHWHFTKNRGFHGDDAAPFEATLHLDATQGARWEIMPLAASKRTLAEEMFARNASAKDIAAAVGVAVATVYRWKADWDRGTFDVH